MGNTEYLKSIRKDLENILNGTTKNDDGEQKTFTDYICEDVLDLDYTCNSKGNLISCRLWVTLGGPNVWIDTNTHEIRLAWGTTTESLLLPNEICEHLNETLETIDKY